MKGQCERGIDHPDSYYSIKKENAALRAENEALKKSIEEYNTKMDKVPSRSRPSNPSEGLSFLADWFDAFYGDAGVNDEVQQDLRKWAKEIDALRTDLAAATGLLERFYNNDLEGYEDNFDKLVDDVCAFLARMEGK